MDIARAAKSIGVSVERLVQAERNAARLTVKQLWKAADKYERPVSLFYLPKPPVEEARIHDFRRLPGEPEKLTSELVIEVRRARERRETALYLSQVLNEHVPVFPHSARLSDDTGHVATTVRELLKVPVESQKNWRRSDRALQAWRSAIESLGVLVFQMSSRRISSEEARGYSISEHTLPVIGINAGESANGRIFTLFHELVHLMLHADGVCDIVERGVPSDEQRVEGFCNAVAAEALVPTESLTREEVLQRVGSPTAWPDEVLDSLARQYSVSSEVILLRLVKLTRATGSFYAAWKDRKRKEYEDRQERERLRRKTKPGGPSAVQMAVPNGGRYFVRLVLQAHEEGELTLADVSRHLGVKAKDVTAVRRRLLKGLP